MLKGQCFGNIGGGCLHYLLCSRDHPRLLFTSLVTGFSQHRSENTVGRLCVDVQDGGSALDHHGALREVTSQQAGEKGDTARLQQAHLNTSGGRRQGLRKPTQNTVWLKTRRL